MSFKLTKTLLMGSFIALGAFGLSACGDSSSSSADPNDPSNPIVVPTKKDANITVSPDVTSRISGDDVVFKARFGIDFVDSTNENSAAVMFTGIEFKVGKGVDVNNLLPANVAVESVPVSFPSKNEIDLNSKNSAFTKISLVDPGFTECGSYSLIVTVYASDDYANEPKKYSRTEVIPFERDAAEYCRETTPSSSSQDPQSNEIVMTSCQVQVSTNAAPGINFETCTAVPLGESTADIVFKVSGNRNNYDIKAESGNGTMFSKITNDELPPSTDDYEVDQWPEVKNNRDAYVSDFKFKNINQTTIEEMLENQGQIYVAKTAAYNAETGKGFYAFAIVDEDEGNNGNRTMTIKVYKVP